MEAELDSSVHGREWQDFAGSFVGCGDEGFEFGEVGVEVVDDAGPGGGVEVVEGPVVVGGGGGDLFAFEASEGAGVPEPEMVGEHADGVVGDGIELARGVGGDPLGLLGREAGDGGVDGGEPLGLVVRGAELVEEGGAEGRGGFVWGRGGGCLGLGGGGEEEEAKERADDHRWTSQDVWAWRKVEYMLEVNQGHRR